MRRRWWMRPGAPTDAEIDSEIRAHLERIEAQEIAAGCDEGEARRRALERFGDVDEVAAGMRRAWIAPPMSSARIALFMAEAAMVAMALFIWSRLELEFTRGTAMDSLAWLLPSMVAIAVPIGVAVGAALASTGSARALPSPALGRPIVGRVVRLSCLAMLLAFAVYLIVPAANTRYVQLALEGEGKQLPASALGLRTLDIPTLATIGDPRQHSPAVAAGWMQLSDAQRRMVATLSRFELQKRFSLPFACVALALAGMAGGAAVRRLRFAPALAAAVAVAAIVLWWMVLVAAEGRALALPAFAGLLAWLPNVVVVAMATVALILLRRRDVAELGDDRGLAAS